MTEPEPAERKCVVVLCLSGSDRNRVEIVHCGAESMDELLEKLGDDCLVISDCCKK